MNHALKGHQKLGRRSNQRAKSTTSGATFRAHFAVRNPGLKPWAMIYNRFAVKAASPVRLAALKLGSASARVWHVMFTRKPKSLAILLRTFGSLAPPN
jgi:hypothetical protein